MLVSASVLKLCSHGCSNARDHADDAVIPYKVTAVFFFERIMSEIQRHGDFDCSARAKFVVELLEMNTAGSLRLDELVDSFIMMGTDLMRCSKSPDDSNMKMAEVLTDVIILLEMGPPTTSSFYDFHKIRLDLDCARNIIRFFDARNPCTCLRQAKQQTKERMVYCYNRDCQTCCQDAKLLTCGRCRLQKYCSKDCQEYDWPNHKSWCKDVASEM